MKMYRVESTFNVPMRILFAETAKVDGVKGKEFIDPEETQDDRLIFGNFKTFGGTDVVKNGVATVEKTGTIETWYRPDITSDCAIKLLSTDKVFEVIGEPENINMMNQYLKLKVKQIGGKQ